MTEERNPDAEPLLDSYPPSRPTSPSSPGLAALGYRPHRRHGPGRRRWLKPLVILAIPPLLLLLYGIAHAIVPALPALPRVRIETGASSSSSSSAAGAPEHELACLCGTTERGMALCDIYHPQGLRASRLVEGTGARIRRLFARARDGQEIKVGVLGGSVSACRGVNPSPEHPEGNTRGPACYHSIVESWLRDTFPSSKVELFNGALGGMDSSYYAFCGTHHIPNDVNLIILEFDVNDQPNELFQTFFDQLLRVLLELESQPAVLILGSWAPQIAQDVGYADPQIVHVPIAHYYDIPYLSLKRLVFNHYLRFPHSTAEGFFLPDLLHPNARGHRVLADLVVSYLDSELCRLDKYGLPSNPPIEDTIETTEPASALVEVGPSLQEVYAGGRDWSHAPDGWEETFNTDTLDALGSERRHFALLTTPYSPPVVKTFRALSEVIDLSQPDPPTPDTILSIPQPALYCADANDPTHPMQPTVHDGWRAWDWKGEKHYWIADEPGARLRVEIEVNAGRVAVYYFRSQHYDLGDALCWVDDNEKGAVRLQGYWDRAYNQAFVSYIDRSVTAGMHYVTCVVADDSSNPTNASAHHFRIVAIMAT